MNAFKSKHFTLDRLADGVYAALHREGGQAVANAGIIDLGDTTLIFDTFLTPRAAADLRRAAEELTGRAVDFVVNSHYHNDHIWGNQVFEPGTRIVSSAATRRLMTTAGQEEYDWYKKNSWPRLQELRSQLDQEQDEQERDRLLFWADYYQALVEAFTGLSVRLPDLTFTERMEIHGSERAAELISFGDGHTGNDSILHLPGEGILFMSDLLFVGCHPYLADGDPVHLISNLASIEKLDAQILVPGHGPVGRPKDLELMVAYVHHCRRLAKIMVERGEAAEAIQQLDVRDAYRSWTHPDFFRINVGFCFQQQKEQSSAGQS